MNLHQEVIMKGTLLVKNVKHLVTCDGDDRLLDGVDVFIRDGVIAGIGQEAGTLKSGTQKSGTAEDVIDASNMVMYPGRINTHHHLYQTFSRNLPQVQNMELFPWLKTLYEIWKHVDEDVVCYSALTGMGELLKTGCTTCLDHHYVFPGSAGDGLLDARTFAASSQPKDLFELVRKEDVDELMSVFPVTRLHYVASDGCALLLRDEIDAMDADSFALYLKYHFATCERADLAGITSHAVDIFRK